MEPEASLNEVMTRLGDFLAERDWEKFHDPKNLAMAIGIEAGELMEIFQWQRNEEAVAAATDSKTRERVREELADVMLYCLSMARVLELDIVQAMLDKISWNAERYPADEFRGSARKYNSPPPG
jgi:NTP pyrophosphatase (non-canonical NTP hydrolase)